MDEYTMLGLIAGFLTTVGFVPQIAKGLRTKSMKDISLVMPIFLGLGMLLWLFYGLWLDSLPIVLWNAISFSLNMVIIVLKLAYGRNDKV
jgi:MtN3 and saliva related transmembrane protein